MPEECSICLQEFVEPVLLPCRHYFCKSCIERCVSSGNVRCPLCNGQHDVPAEGFPLYIDENLDDVQESTANRDNVHVQESTATRNQPQRRYQSCDCDCIIEHVGEVCKVVHKTADSSFHNYFHQRSCTRKLVFTITMLVLTFFGNVAGAVKLKSDCPKEREVAIYLFINASFAQLFWIVFLAIGLGQEQPENPPTAAVEKHTCIHVVYVFSRIISLACLITGTVLASKLSDMIEECPLYVEDWDKTFMGFAIFFLAIDWLLFVFLACYCLYVRREKNQVENST